jgi:hypothetical protein
METRAIEASMRIVRTEIISRRRWTATLAAAIGGLLLCAAASRAQDWAKAMFDHTTHDFGAVARGAKAEHRFIVKNVYEEDLRIESVKSSCGCSTPRLSKQVLKTWETAEVVVTLDTRDFTGPKDATIFVKFAPPYVGEVQLHIHAKIRGDIVVQPGAVQFGALGQGAGAEQTLAISYAGRNDWKIERVECADPHIETRLVETKRVPGEVGYSLLVKLKQDAPAGYLRDQLMLVTNDFDPRSSRVPVTVEGLVAAALTVRPSPLMMGVVPAGQPITRNLVIQGRAPFRILAVRSADDRFQCKPPADAKTAHILPITFVSKDAAAPGKLSTKVRIETDLVGTGPVEVDVYVQVVSESPR